MDGLPVRDGKAVCLEKLLLTVLKKKLSEDAEFLLTRPGEGRAHMLVLFLPDLWHIISY